MSSKINVAIMGGTGYAAAELIKRLIIHPNTNLTKIASIDHVGENIGKVHKIFSNRIDMKFENLSPGEIAKDCDLVFLTLPHKVSSEFVPELIKSDVKIIDFSGDYRIQDVDIYNEYYKATHSNPENIKKFVYGLPELNRSLIKESKYISNPGCFPTATILSILPLAEKKLLSKKIRVVGPTGSSGSGVHPQAGTHHPVRVNNLKSYKPLFHQHQPEMEQVLQFATGEHDLSVDFIPMSAPLSRGILVNTILDLPKEITEEEIDKIYSNFFINCPFVKYTGFKSFPEVASIKGTNFVEVGWSLREEKHGFKTFVGICAIDNLVKGASGQAIQNMNLMYDINETEGLNDYGTWP